MAYDRIEAALTLYDAGIERSAVHNYLKHIAARAPEPTLEKMEIELFLKLDTLGYMKKTLEEHVNCGADLQVIQNIKETILDCLRK